MNPHPTWLFAVSAINHLLLMVNSSVNFLIYCAVGSRFRSALTCRIGRYYDECKISQRLSFSVSNFSIFVTSIF